MVKGSTKSTEVHIPRTNSGSLYINLTERMCPYGGKCAVMEIAVNLKLDTSFPILLPFTRCAVFGELAPFFEPHP